MNKGCREKKEYLLKKDSQSKSDKASGTEVERFGVRKKVDLWV